MRKHAALTLYDYLLVPCKKCSNVSSEFGYISRLQPWCVCRFTYIWIAAPVFYYPLGEVFWDFPLFSPLACCCSSCFSLTKIPTFFPCFSVVSILCMRERNLELIERRKDLVLRQICLYCSNYHKNHSVLFLLLVLLTLCYHCCQQWRLGKTQRMVSLL